MSSSICPHFTQNAWKKDLCSNCFKSKDEHKPMNSSTMSKFSVLSSRAKMTSNFVSKTEVDTRKPDRAAPMKSIIKKTSISISKTSRSKSHKVCFPKNLSEIIGYGGEWSDDDSDDDDHDFMNIGNEHDDNAATSTDDEETVELKRITRANTDYNMNNGNLLGDPQDNIKKSFAALKLGAPQVDKEGKKQTLQINVVPFGATGGADVAKPAVVESLAAAAAATSTTTMVKAKFEPRAEVVEAVGVPKQNVTIKSTKKTTTTTQQVGSLSSATGSCTTKTVTSYTSAATRITATSNRPHHEVSTSTSTSTCTSSDSDGKNSPPIERAMEKSLLDEISETLEQKQHESKKESAAAAVTSTAPKIKFEITSLSETIENKPFLELKKPIARNAPITKDHTKPKVNVFHKYSDTDSNCSDGDNGVSAYYDVVETTQISYENLPDGKCEPIEKQMISGASKQDQPDKSIFSSSQYITDMLLSSKTRAASYNLHEGNFMTSKITSDGLIVTKCSSDDALDSTGSSFDGSSDEETSYNMTRSESDSGIGISIGSEYKNVNIGEKEKEQERERDRNRLRTEKKLSVSTNNSDYEDIQVANQTAAAALKAKNEQKRSAFLLEKSRELHGEPDGSADPDGSLASKELPALPKSPPPTKTIDARPSFLHGLQKQHPPVLLKKPDLPTKPVVAPANSPLKTFITKRHPTNVEQQVINQLQMVMSKSTENLSGESAKDDGKLKKGRAPNPPPEQKSSAPPTPERDYNLVGEFEDRERERKAKLEGEKSSVADDRQSAAKVASHDGASSNDDEAKKSSNGRKDKEVDKSSSPTVTLGESVSSSLSASAAALSTAAAAAAAAAAGAGTGPSAAPNASTASSSIYTRKLPTTPTAVSPGSMKNASSPAVIREKDKRERATINPKFRSLNTFVTQRSNAIKNLQLQSATPASGHKQSLTPDPMPKKHKNLSMSQECLAEASASAGSGTTSASTLNLAMTSNDKKNTNAQSAAPAAPAKTKTKFSIKKFLRMGTSKTTDNLHKKDGVYSEICTGEEAGVVGKPRLVIIHPIDINPTAVEVVKDITKTNDAVAAQTVAVVTTKPPAPPLRSTGTDGQRTHEANKPARPPPPKSAELRRKQKIGLSAATEAGGSVKCKSDNVYANLGEIRSSIAPRKPERTASMREREAQLELARRRHVGSRNENVDTISICSSNGDNVSTDAFSTNPNGASSFHKTENKNNNNNDSHISTLSPQLSTSSRSTTSATPTSIDGKPPPSGGSRTSTFERRKSDPKIAIASKLEIFENRNSHNGHSGATSPVSPTSPITSTGGSNEGRPNSLKDSVRKITNTIDSYLKDKRDYENMYEFVKSPSSPPPPPVRSMDLATASQRLLAPRRNNLYSDTASVASYTRSEYGPVRSYGLNNSLANIPRIISASYCGSEVGEFDIYSPYSYYGSEAGGDVATDINDSVWGVPSAIKNRAKATNRLRMRKGRSVVHKTIEDNYTAVVVANHEALAQVLEQMQQSPVVPAALRPLANAINLRFEDFNILDGAQAFVVGKKAFHAALWTTAQVTLALSADCNQLSGVGGELNQLSGGISGVLNPITEFCDLVPSYHLPLMPSTEVTLLQATISVLPRLQLDTLQSIGTILKGKSQVLDKSNFNFRGSIPNLAGLKDGAGASALRNVVSVQNLSTLNEEGTEKSSTEGGGEATQTPGVPAFDDVMTREVAFIMLQLVNGMKNLQAKAIEEMPLSLSNVILSKDVENKDAQARLCVLQGTNNDEEEPMGTLCKCAHIALTDMLPQTKITSIVGDILAQERAESLSKAKSVLEFVLWGPSDVSLSGSTKERELALQRWLDLERATVLHGLVRTRVELTVYDECHLMFLVRSTAKMMNDAANVICSYQQHSSSVAEHKQRED